MRYVVFYSNLFISSLFGPTHPTLGSLRCHTHDCFEGPTSCKSFLKSALTGNRMQGRRGKWGSRASPTSSCSTTPTVDCYICVYRPDTSDFRVRILPHTIFQSRPRGANIIKHIGPVAVTVYANCELRSLLLGHGAILTHIYKRRLRRRHTLLPKT